MSNLESIEFKWLDWGGIASAFFAFMGSLLPWYTLLGLSEAGISSTAGVLVFILSIIAFASAAALLANADSFGGIVIPAPAFRIAVLVSGSLSLLLGGFNMLDIATTDTLGLEASVGAGLYLVTMGGIGLVVVGVLGVIKMQSEPK